MIVVSEMEHTIMQTYKTKLIKKERCMLTQHASFFFTNGFSLGSSNVSRPCFVWMGDVAPNIKCFSLWTLHLPSPQHWLPGKSLVLLTDKTLLSYADIHPDYCTNSIFLCKDCYVYNPVSDWWIYSSTIFPIKRKFPYLMQFVILFAGFLYLISKFLQ